MTEAPSRRLAAVLAADVAGYARLMGADESGTLASLRRLRRKIFAPLVAQHRGEIVKNMGDGWLVAFAAAGDAVACAVALQEALAAAEGLKLRIGVHLGDIAREEEDIFGDGVNIAARLQAIAEPGAVVISDMARRSAGVKMTEGFAALGPQRLKNIAEPVLAFGRTAGALPAAAAAPPAEKPAIAVLPFANLSGDPAQDYFSDGISEDIAASLSRIGWLLVIARDSATAFKGEGREADPGRIAAALGVHYLLQGSLRKAGARVRVSAQLIEAATGKHLWSERYDRDLDDIFAVQDDVVGAIVHALGAPDGVLEKLERRRSAGRESVTAYDFYLQGREAFDRGQDDGYRAAEALFRQAIDRDETFAQAYSALAWLYFLRFKVLRSLPFEAVEGPARELALQAIRLDEKEYRAHWVLGFIAMHGGKYEQGLAQFERALAINPNDANVLIWSSEIFVYWGRPEDALARCARALRRNPNCPDFYRWVEAFALFHLGRYEEAAAALERMTAPGHARRLLAATYAQLGRLEAARTEAAAYLELDPGFSIGAWATSERYSDPKELQRYVDGLRKAGLPA